MPRFTREQIDTIGTLVVGKLLPGRSPHTQYVQVTAPSYQVGSRMILDGALRREFVYSHATGPLLDTQGAANMNYIPGEPAHLNVNGWQGNLGAVAPIGARTVSFTDTVAKPKDYFAGGHFVAYPGASNFVQRIIVSGPSVAGTAITLVLDEPITQNLGGVFATCTPSPYGNLQHGVGDFMSCMCVPLMNITSGNHFWGQVRGPIVITPDGGLALPGRIPESRDVYFHSGIISPWYVTAPVGACSPQRAGYIIGASTAAAGDLLVMLQLD